MLNNWKFWFQGGLLLRDASVIFAFIAMIEENWFPFLMTSVWMCFLSWIWIYHGNKMKSSADNSDEKENNSDGKLD